MLLLRFFIPFVRSILLFVSFVVISLSVSFSWRLENCFSLIWQCSCITTTRWRNNTITAPNVIVNLVIYFVINENLHENHKTIAKIQLVHRLLWFICHELIALFGAAPPISTYKDPTFETLTMWISVYLCKFKALNWDYRISLWIHRLNLRAARTHHLE